MRLLCLGSNGRQEHPVFTEVLLFRPSGGGQLGGPVPSIAHHANADGLALEDTQDVAEALGRVLRLHFFESVVA